MWKARIPVGIQRFIQTLLCALSLKVIFQLPLRATEGLLSGKFVNMVTLREELGGSYIYELMKELKRL